MKNTANDSSTPVAVKPANNTSPTIKTSATKKNAAPDTTSTSSPAPKKVAAIARPTEKVLQRIDDMNAAKVTKWLEKTSKTIRAHYDTVKHRRKCTAAYWDGLHKRYSALTVRAKTENAWESYCVKNSLAFDHDGMNFIA